MTFSRVMGDEEADTSAAAEDEAMVIDLDPFSKVKFREFFIADGWCVLLSTMVNFEDGLFLLYFNQWFDALQWGCFIQ